MTTRWRHAVRAPLLRSAQQVAPAAAWFPSPTSSPQPVATHRYSSSASASSTAQSSCSSPTCATLPAVPLPAPALAAPVTPRLAAAAFAMAEPPFRCVRRGFTIDSRSSLPPTNARVHEEDSDGHGNENDDGGGGDDDEENEGEDEDEDEEEEDDDDDGGGRDDDDDDDYEYDRRGVEKWKPPTSETIEILRLGSRGAWVEMLEVVQQARATGAADGDLYNAAIFALQRQGHWEECVRLLHQMRADGITPTRQAYNWVLIVCRRHKRVDEARDVFRSLLEDALPIDRGIWNNQFAILTTARCWDELRECVGIMAASGVPLTKDTFHRILRRLWYDTGSGQDSELALFATTMMDWMREYTVQPDEMSYNLTLRILGFHGKHADVSRTLESMKAAGLRPTADTYAYVIASCNRSGFSSNVGEEALALVTEMKGLGVKPNKATIKAVLSVSRVCVDKELSKALIASVSLGESESNDSASPSMWSPMGRESISSRSRSRSTSRVPEAVRETRELRRRNEARRRSVVGRGLGDDREGYEEYEKYDEEPEWEEQDGEVDGPWGRRRRQGRQGRQRYWGGDASAALSDDVDRVWHALYSGGRPSREDCLAAFRALSDRGRYFDAWRMMRSLKARGCFHQDTATYNELLKSCVPDGRWVQANTLLTEMKQNFVPLDNRTYAMAICTAAVAGNTEETMRMLREKDRSGLPQELITYTQALAACEVSGSMTLAMSLMHEARDIVKLELDQTSYLHVLSTCAKVSSFDNALIVLREMKHVSGMVPNTACYTSAIHACCKRGRFDIAQDLLREMREAGSTPTVVTYSIILFACSKLKDKGERMPRALEIVEDMRKQGVSPNSVTYSALLSVCIAAAESKWALSILDEMMSEQVSLSFAPFELAARACEASQSWEDVLGVVQRMRAAEFAEPSSMVRRIALRLCEAAGQTDAVETINAYRVRSREQEES